MPWGANKNKGVPRSALRFQTDLVEENLSCVIAEVALLGIEIEPEQGDQIARPKITSTLTRDARLNPLSWIAIRSFAYLENKEHNKKRKNDYRDVSLYMIDET